MSEFTKPKASNNGAVGGMLGAPTNAPITPLRLFYVTYFDVDGNRMELLVWSETLDGVPDHWRRHFRENDELDCIFEVPIASPKPGPIGWHTPGGVCAVFDRLGKGGSRKGKINELPPRVQTLLAAEYKWIEKTSGTEYLSYTDMKIQETIKFEDDRKTEAAGELSLPKNGGTPSPLRLYFVDFIELELFVWSETVDDVADHWRGHYDLYDDDEESDESYKPDRIFEISIAAPTPGVVMWHALWRKGANLPSG
jgi:hypothetical protein